MTATDNQGPVDLAFLLTIPVFGGISGPGLARVAACLRRRSLGPGATVVATGDGAREMFIVEHGEVEVVAYRQPRGAIDPVPPPPPGTECELILAVLSRGSCCGEMSLVDMQPPSAMVRAKGPVTLLALSYGDVQILQAQDPETFTRLVMNIAREVSLRLRSANRILVDVLLSLQDCGPGATYTSAAPLLN